MCLNLQENWKEETEKFRNSSEILYGYKIIRIQEDSFFSPFQHFEYKLPQQKSG